MRISDWSSDVCSSDLPALIAAVRLSPSVEPECVRTAWPRRSLRSTSKSSFDQLSWPLTHSPASPYQPAKAPRVASDWRKSPPERRSEEHTSELQSLMRISYAVFCLKKKTE